MNFQQGHKGQMTIDQDFESVGEKMNPKSSIKQQQQENLFCIWDFNSDIF